jgi:hypothetical protein
MAEKIKIIYEDWEGKQTRSPKGVEVSFNPVVKEALVLFNEQNTIWQDYLSYNDNFDAFVQDIFECGFVYVSPTEVITIFQIKKCEMYNSEPPKKKPSRKRTKRRKPNQPNQQN